MPPLKEALPVSFSPNASGLLVPAGHGRQLSIVDASYDIPDHAKIFYYLGNEEGELTAARAFADLVPACPIEETVWFMDKDTEDHEDRVAPYRNKSAIKELGFQAVRLLKDPKGGFYDKANNTTLNRAPIFCMGAFGNGYDCITMKIGDSQNG